MITSVLSLAVANKVASVQLEAQKIADGHFVSNSSYTITYDISSRGEIKGNLAEFRKIVAETYADARGWKRAGVTMKEVASGGQAHVILASGAQVAAASPGCSAKLSCRVGSLVLINDDRWNNGSESYDELGVPLIDYRRMVINHETGHFLGHDHIQKCETDGGLGPIMIQQSTGLVNCRPNSWPLPNELWVKR